MNASSLTRLFILAAIWGGSFLFMRLAVPELGALPTAFFRVFLAAIGLWAMLLVRRIPLRMQGKWPAALVLGVINAGVPFVMFSLAARHLPAGYSAILNATTPLMGVLIGATAFGEPVTTRKLAGVFLGLLGVVVLAHTGPLAITGTVLWSVAACLIATACYALASYLTRQWITLRGGLDSQLLSLGSQVGATLALLPFMLWQISTSPVAWGSISGRAWGSVAGLGLLCTSLAFILYFQLIAAVGPLRSLLVTFLIPLFGVLWGWLFLGEPVSAAYAAGGGLIGLALWLILRPDATAAPAPARR